MSENRHDILDLEGGGYISINRPKDAPPLTAEQQADFRELARIALSHIDEQTTKALGSSGEQAQGEKEGQCSSQ